MTAVFWGICIYKNIRLYFYSWRWYLCGTDEQSQRVCTHKGVIGSRESQWTTDFSQNSGTYIVYNSHMTCSNSSFSLVMVTPTSHFVFHWLQFMSMCFLFPIGYFYGWTYLPLFAEFNHVHRSRWYFDSHLVDIIFGRMKLSTISADTTPAVHGDIPVITRILSMYLSTTSAGHVNILQYFIERIFSFLAMEEELLAFLLNMELKVQNQ